MDERFPSDNGPDMTNHQENCNHTPAEVGWYTAVFVFNGSLLASQTHAWLAPKSIAIIAWINELKIILLCYIISLFKYKQLFNSVLVASGRYLVRQFVTG